MYIVLGYVLGLIAHVLSFLGRVKLREENVGGVKQAKSHKIRKKKFEKYHVPDMTLTTQSKKKMDHTWTKATQAP